MREVEPRPAAAATVTAQRPSRCSSDPECARPRAPRRSAAATTVAPSRVRDASGAVRDVGDPPRAGVAGLLGDARNARAAVDAPAPALIAVTMHRSPTREPRGGSAPPRRPPASRRRRGRPTVALPSSTANRKRPDRRRSAGSAHRPASSAATTLVRARERRRVPAAERARGDVAHAVVLGRRQQPAGAHSSSATTAARRRRGCPRIWTFAREVISTMPLPSAAASRSARRPPSASRAAGQAHAREPAVAGGVHAKHAGAPVGRGRATTADRAARPGSIDSPAYPSTITPGLARRSNRHAPGLVGLPPARPPAAGRSNGPAADERSPRMTSTIGEILPVAARRFGARTALLVGDRSFSFDDLRGAVEPRRERPRRGGRRSRATGLRCTARTAGSGSSRTTASPRPARS